MTGVRAARAAEVVKLVDAGDDDALRFVRVAGNVHVLSAGYVPERHKELFGDGEAERMMRFALGEAWAVCGKHIVRHRGGFEASAQLVSHFPDEMLCVPCCEAFGDRSVLIFEANQDDGSDPTQLGQLAGDLLTKGQALR